MNKCIVLSICSVLDFFDVVKGLHKDGENDIQKEKGANHDQKDRENYSHPGNVRIHQVVHDLRPAFKSDELKDSKKTEAKIVEHGDTVVYKLFIDQVIYCLCIQASVRRCMAVPILWALEQAHRVYTA